MKPTFRYWENFFSAMDQRIIRSMVGAGKIDCRKYVELTRKFRDKINKDKAFTCEHRFTFKRQTERERLWYLSGMPYYKIWPSMSEALFQSKLDFGAEHFQPPFVSYVVMFPCEIKWTKACLVTVLPGERIITPRDDPDSFTETERRKYEESRAEAGGIDPLLTIAFMWRYAHFSADWIELPIYSGMTIEESIEKTNALKEKEGEITARASEGIAELYGYTWEQQISMVRAAISVAMFATDQHDLIMPDLDIETIYVNHPGGRTKASKAIASAKAEAIIKKHRGWKVGSEIELPRPIVIGKESGEWQGGELSASHIRSGHMRMQPCGPKSQDRKLIFVAPTVVRPDLPEMVSHGYRITDKCLK